MKILSIHLKNFRVFRDTFFEFSADQDKNVTLIIADNGSGKTTLSQSFIWCLYGKKDEKFTLEGNYCSSDTVNETPIGQKFDTSVTVKLENNGITYTFKRTETFVVKRDLNDKNQKKATPNQADDKISCVIHEPGKESKVETISHNVTEIISRILPDRLASFVFFNGEQLNIFAQKIHSSQSSKFIKDAVSTLLGTKAWDNSIRHMTGKGSTGNVKSVKKTFLTEIAERSQTSSNKDLRSIIDRCEQLREKLDAEKLSLDDELTTIKEKIDSISKNLESYKDSEKLEKERKSLSDRAKNCEDEINRLNTEIRNTFKNNFFRFVADGLIGRLLKNLEEYKKINADESPNVPADVIKHILQHHKCICGTEINEQSPEYERLKSLLSAAPSVSTDKAVNTIFNAVYAEYNRATDESEIHQRVGTMLCDISKEQTKIDEYHTQIQAISNQLLEGDESSSIVKNLEAQKISLSSRMSQILSRQGEITSEYKANESAYKSAASQLQTVTQASKQIEFYQRCSLYVDEVIKMLEDSSASVKQKIREDLDAEVKSVFKSIGWDSITTHIDEDFSFTYAAQDGLQHQLSEGQSIVSAISCIAGIIRTGKNIVNSDPNQKETVNNIPMFMDAPLSKLDNKRIEKFSINIPQFVDQLVIVIKDTDGNQAYKALKSKIGKKLRMQNIAGSATQTEILEWDE